MLNVTHRVRQQWFQKLQQKLQPHRCGNLFCTINFELTFYVSNITLLFHKQQNFPFKGPVLSVDIFLMEESIPKWKFSIFSIGNTVLLLLLAPVYELWKGL